MLLGSKQQKKENPIKNVVEMIVNKKRLTRNMYLKKALDYLTFIQYFSVLRRRIHVWHARVGSAMRSLGHEVDVKMSSARIEGNAYDSWSTDDSEPGHLKKRIVSSKDRGSGNSALNCTVILRDDHIHLGMYQKRGRGYSIFRSGLVWEDIISNLQLGTVVHIKKMCDAVIELYAIRNTTPDVDADQSSDGD